MEGLRTVWSDERLDDLNHKVDDLRSEVRGLRSEMRAESAALRTEMGTLRTETIALRTEVNARFDSMQRSMLTLMGTMVVGFVSILATQL